MSRQGAPGVHIPQSPHPRHDLPSQPAYRVGQDQCRISEAALYRQGTNRYGFESGNWHVCSCIYRVRPGEVQKVDARCSVAVSTEPVGKERLDAESVVWRLR